MKILIWKSKHFTAYVKADNEEKAYLYLLKRIEEDWGYGDLKEKPKNKVRLYCNEDSCRDNEYCYSPDEHISKTEREKQQARHEKENRELSWERDMFNKAKKGDWKAAKALIQYRTDKEYEYECVEEEELTDPE